jgi:hypothetical protein
VASSGSIIGKAEGRIILSVSLIIIPQFLWIIFGIFG